MPKSQMERLWVIGAAFVAFILIVLGYVVFISPQRTTTSGVNAQVATARQQNDTLEARIQALSAQNKNLSSYEKAVARASAALPSTSGLPDFLRTLQAIGNATLSNVAMLTVGPPSPYVKPAAPSAPTATATPSATPTTSTTTTAPAPSIYVLPVTAQVTGSNAHLLEFLRQLQSVQPRAVLISQITETTGNGATTGAAATTSTGTSSLQLTMSVFVQPGGVAAAATGTP